MLECTLKERCRQMEIQAKESDGLRQELRRKDDIINEYESMIKQFNETENMELTSLRKEMVRLRDVIMNNNLLIREYENKIEQLQNKNSKLMSVMTSPRLPRPRAQGVSAPPTVYNPNTRQCPKSTR